MLLLLPHPTPFTLLLPRALLQESPAQESQSRGTGPTHGDQEWVEEADGKGVAAWPLMTVQAPLLGQGSC